MSVGKTSDRQTSDGLYSRKQEGAPAFGGQGLQPSAPAQAEGCVEGLCPLRSAGQRPGDSGHCSTYEYKKTLAI